MANARWSPTTVEELSAALADETLTEGHYVDFKRELAAGAAANKAIAKDLAAFAIDGGMIIFGVEERKGDRPEVFPIELDGMKERIDHIARSAVEPPVYVQCTELRTGGDRSTGCLVVQIPPSPHAPHQVGDRLYGRSDTTNFVLAPDRIREIHDRQRRRRAAIEELVDLEVGRDPTPGELREHAHLFIVAEPVGAPEELLFEALGELRFSSWLYQEVQPGLSRGWWEPDVVQGNVSRRANGWACHSYCIAEDRTIRPNGNSPARESSLIDVEVNENGGVRLFCARATDERHGMRMFLDAVVVGLALRTVEIARSVAVTTRFVGGWEFALAIENLKGSVSFMADQNLRLSPSGYSEERYRQTAGATLAELHEPKAVADRLVAKLLRGMQSPYEL